MPEPGPSLSTLADSLVGTFPACDDAPLARALFRELATGQPVERSPADRELAMAFARWSAGAPRSAPHVESNCAVTGNTARLTVAPSGVSDGHAEKPWLPFPAPATMSPADITGTFCCRVHFLAGGAAADQWVALHDGGTALTLPDAFELGRLATRGCA
jgi:hypothetical protein